MGGRRCGRQDAVDKRKLCCIKAGAVAKDNDARRQGFEQADDVGGGGGVEAGEGVVDDEEARASQECFGEYDFACFAVGEVDEAAVEQRVHFETANEGIEFVLALSASTRTAVQEGTHRGAVFSFEGSPTGLVILADQCRERPVTLERNVFDLIFGRAV